MPRAAHTSAPRRTSRRARFLRVLRRKRAALWGYRAEQPPVWPSLRGAVQGLVPGAPRTVMGPRGTATRPAASPPPRPPRLNPGPEKAGRSPATASDSPARCPRSLTAAVPSLSVAPCPAPHFHGEKPPHMHTLAAQNLCEQWEMEPLRRHRSEPEGPAGSEETVSSTDTRGASCGNAGRSHAIPGSGAGALRDLGAGRGSGTVSLPGTHTAKGRAWTAQTPSAAHAKVRSWVSDEESA